MKIVRRIMTWGHHIMAAVGVVFLSLMLLTTIHLTTFDARWPVFLAGVLGAAILALVSRKVNSRWTIKRKTAQLGVARGKLATEIRLRAHAEAALQQLRGGVELVDEALPAMLAYFDGEQRIQYHNRSFKRLIGIGSAAITGRSLNELPGHTGYRDLQDHLINALQGRETRFEWIQHTSGGEACRLDAHFMPHHGPDGKVRGVFALLNDVTRTEDLQQPPADEPQNEPLNMGARLVAALERDQFTLYWQDIVALGQPAGVPHYEVLLRMDEEEQQQIPPGTFLPWAEQFGLLPQIDRWVVQHVIEFAARSEPAVYMVNVTAPTVRDRAFPGFLRQCLQANGVSGSTLGFELVESELLADRDAYRNFIEALEGTGCRIAVSGFGAQPLSLRLLKQMGVQILKLDGDLVLGVERSPADLGKLRAVNRAAHAAGMQTVAECVENDLTRALLSSIDTDFAQGFGIATPRPMVAARARENAACAA
jgi:PAS domain S-box-containing protein